MYILENDSVRNNMPPDVNDWLERHSPTFEDWARNVLNLHGSDKGHLAADRLGQKLIESFPGLETVANEINKFSEDTALKDEEKLYVNAIVDALSDISRHQNHIYDLLR